MADNKSYQEYQQRRRRRRLQRTLRRVVVLVLAVLVLLGLAWVITNLIESAGDGRRLEENTTPGASQTGGLPQNSESQPGSSTSGGDGPALPALPEVDNSAWNFVGPVQQTINTMEIIQPDSRMLAVPENGRISMEYFDNVTFIGDSISQGLWQYPSYGITNAHFLTYLGASPKAIYDGSILNRHKNDPRGPGSEEPLVALVESQPDNVYILMGANALVNKSLDDDSFMHYYREMVIKIQEVLDPSVGIYVQSITPVKEGGDARFDMDRIRALNNRLAQMAQELGVYFVDLNEVLAGDDGYMIPEYSASDGLHLNPFAYEIWKEYLVTHTVYHKRHDHLYLENSNPQS